MLRTTELNFVIGYSKSQVGLSLVSVRISKKNTKSKEA